MAMARRLTRTIRFIGLQETNTIGYYKLRDERKRPASASSSVQPDPRKDDTQRATSRATERANVHLQGNLLAGSDTLALSPQTPGHGTEDIRSGLQLKPQTQRGGARAAATGGASVVSSSSVWCVLL